MQQNTHGIRNSSPENTRDWHFTRRAKVAAVVSPFLLLGAGLGAAHLLGEGKEPVPTTHVHRMAQDGDTSWGMAKDIKLPDTDVRDISDLIEAASNADGNPGPQAGEIIDANIPTKFVDPQKVAETNTPLPPTAQGSKQG